MQLESHTRPRPPASRRSSQKASHLPASKPTSPPTPLAPSTDQNFSRTSSRSPTKRSPSSHLAQDDLGLDLPSHLTAALGAARFRQPRVLHDIFGASNGQDPVAHSGIPDSPSSAKTLHRKWSALAESSPSGRHEAANGVSAPGSPLENLDREWVGALGREELELLLYEASEVIRERERDLGIAAAIGQALLQKNISLRSKHQGVMSRLSSSSDLLQDEDDQDSEDFQPPVYSPPTNDGEGSRLYFDEKTATPMPDACLTPTQGSGFTDGGYFASANAQHQRLASSSSSSSSSHVGFPGMQPHLSGLISSAPQSPGGVSVASSVNGYASPGGAKQRRLRHKRSTSLQASETQKQLSFLSAQNETLLAQLAELQEEAEQAKAEGSRSLRKLNKEIEGLQTELEAATERNVELEGNAETNAASLDRPASRRYDPSRGPASPSRPVTPLPGKSGLKAATEGDPGMSNSEFSISGGIDAILARSSAAQEYTSEQRDVVVRLLGKVRELEKMNALLEEDRKDREGRLGQALERGVRISDQYDAVLHAHEHDVGEQSQVIPSLSSDFVTVDQFGGVKSSESTPSDSPAARWRKAIGNRVQVEGRRTVRNALRQHRRESVNGVFADPFGPSSDSGTPSGMLSTSSTLDSLLSASTVRSTSTASSAESRSGGPRRRRSALALNRPRILITPSMEDLAAKRKEQAEGWEDESVVSSVDAPAAEDTADAKRRSDSLDPSDAHWIAELARRRWAHDQHTQDEELLSTEQYSSGRPQTRSGSGTRTPSGRRRRRRSSSSSSHGDHQPGMLGATLQGELQGLNYHQGDLAEPDFDPVLQSEELGRSPSSLNPSRPSLRHKASFESVASDIANLRWSTRDHEQRSRNEVLALPQDAVDYSDEGQTTPRGQLISLQDMSDVDIALCHRTLDGHGYDGDQIVAQGALRDLHEPREEQYSMLEQISHDTPVQWADDDDYGRPIKESDARKMGLLMPSLSDADSSGRKRLGLSAGVGLISWAIGSAKSRGGTEPSTRRRLPAIESAEQVASQQQREAQLRTKYHLAMNNRGLQTRRHSAYGSVDEDEQERAEIDNRTWSLSSPQKRRSLRQPPRGKEDTDDSFEMIHHESEALMPHPQSKRQQKVRLHQQGLEAVNEITAWASLVFVLIIAFFVSASRGEMNPKRILGGGSSVGSEVKRKK